jgi:Uma2 family endonuclease
MATMVSRSTNAPVPLGEYVPTADQRIVIRGVSWAGFQALLAARGERRVPRMAFLDGAVEIMGPSRDHEGIKSLIGGLLEAYCLARDIVIAGYGSWLLQGEAKAAGVEPDECYVFGPNPKAKDRPDLAIEVVWTSGGISKLEAYRRLGVGEIWFWNDDSISVHVLVEDRYEARSQSACLPELDLALICRLCALDTLNEAVEELHLAIEPGSEQ